MNGRELVETLRSQSLPPVVVAELSGNHGGDLSRAMALVDAAAEAGADAVKLQTYKPETITVEARTEPFLLKEGLWTGRYLADLYAEAMTPWEWHEPLADRARERGVALFSSPFDETAVDFLEETISPPLHKIASFELNHFPLLRKVAHTGKPVVASTGASKEEEVAEAVSLLRAEGCSLVILLQCVSEYPADPAEFQLSGIPKLREDFGALPGLSDHSPGSVVPVAATALGARLVEKHFVLDREDGSVDAGFSMEPEEFKAMADAVRLAHASLGESWVGLRDSQAGSRRFLRSIWVVKPVRTGEVFSTENLRVARPSDGLSPARWEEVLGKRAARDLERGHPLSEEDLEDENE